MPDTIPTTQQIVNRILSNLQGQLNQTIPPSQRAWANVLAVALAMISTSEYKYMASQVMENLAITATGPHLDVLGSEYNTPRQQAISCIAVLSVPGTPATIIPQGKIIVDTATGNLYVSTAAATIGATPAAVSVTALIAGSATNVSVSDTFSLQSAIVGVSSPISVRNITTQGTDAETDSVYRVQLLAVIRAVGGGSNTADVAVWAQSVPGVAMAYCYGGLPFNGLLLTPNEYAAQLVEIIGSPSSGTFSLYFNGQVTAPLPFNPTAGQIATAMQALFGAGSVSCSELSNGAGFKGFMLSGFSTFAPVFLASNGLGGGTNPTVYVFPNAPPARTVYVQCTTSVNPQGIPPAAMLTAVTQAIHYNAAGIANQPLGITMDELFVMPCTSTGFYVTITTLNPGNSTAGVVQTAIQTALATYFSTQVQPYVDGVTPVFARSDLITQASVTAVVQSVLQTYGASCASVGFGPTPGAFLATYQLGEGELANFAGVTYQ
jgi:hypothetical protein